MSVTAQTPYKKFTAAPGATLFSTGFRLILASDLVVKVNGSVVSTGFTVSSLGAAPGSDVTFGTPMVGGEIVELVRAVPKTRLTDYQQLGDYQAGSVNNDFDRLVMMVQDSQFLSDLAVLLPVGDAAAPLTLPALADRALKFLAFDALGKAIAAAGVTGSPVSTFMASVILAANAAAARAAIGAAETGVNSSITSLTGLTSPIPSANTVGKIESLPNPTLSANAMTLPASTHALDFRSATLSSGLATTVSGTAAALVIPAGATLGTVSAVQSTIVEVILNNSGTLEKAVVNLAGGNDLSETGVINTTAISAASTAANVFYSTTARTGVPYRVVRTITSTQAAAGQWSTSPSAIQGAGGNALDAMQSLGYGADSDVTGSRALNTVYYNTSGRPRKITGWCTNGGAGVIEVQVNSLPQWRFTAASGSPEMPFFGIVQPGRSYQLNNSGSVTVTRWIESA
jgi:hypothetical protein